jgi:hypothetical protein
MKEFKQTVRTILAGLNLLHGARALRLYTSANALRRFYHLTVNWLDIRRYDRKVGQGSALWDSGFICYSKAPKEILEAAQHFKAGEKVVINDTTLAVVAYLVNMVKGDVLAYLGTDVRVDIICTTVVPASSEVFKSVSGSWHTDCVGHRLKLYFCIEGYGDVPTRYRRGSNRSSYFPRLREQRRHSGQFDFTRRPDEILLKHETGDITLFDTNGEHRGGYDKDHGIRKVLLIEFADRNKSNCLAGRAPIGPGNSICRVFSILKSIADARAQDLMLDPTLLVAESAETYRYDWPKQSALLTITCL